MNSYSIESCHIKLQTSKCLFTGMSMLYSQKVFDTIGPSNGIQKFTMSNGLSPIWLEESNL